MSASPADNFSAVGSDRRHSLPRLCALAAADRGAPAQMLTSAYYPHATSAQKQATPALIQRVVA